MYVLILAESVNVGEKVIFKIVLSFLLMLWKISKKKSELINQLKMN